jgi:CHAD domain-containing protein
MHDYVRHQTAILLRRLAYQVNRAAKKPDEEVIHDLRVAIRRLSRCLQVFSRFYPGNSWKKVRHRLRDLMDAAGRVRDRDIAAKLLHDAGVPDRAAAFKRLHDDRRAAVRELAAEVRHWKNNSYSRKWRAQLDLSR